MVTTRFSETFLLAKMWKSMAFMARGEKEEFGRESLPYVHSCQRVYISPNANIYVGFYVWVLDENEEEIIVGKQYFFVQWQKTYLNRVL